MASELLSGVGRIVWGHPLKSRVKKDNNRQPVIKNGVQVEEYCFGVAFPKAEFEANILPWMQYEASTIFPQGVPQKFSWKFSDGDGIDSDGKPFSEREGYAGHYVLNINNGFAPQVVKNENGKYRQLEEHEFDTGDFVNIKLNLKANKPLDATHTPSLYVNPQMIELVGYGQKIVSANIDPNDAFGGQTYTLPAGASATPLASNTGVEMPQPAAPAAPLPPVAQPAAPAAPLPPVAQPAAPAAPLPPPATGFVQQAGQAPAAPAAPLPVPPAGR